MSLLILFFSVGLTSQDMPGLFLMSYFYRINTYNVLLWPFNSCDGVELVKTSHGLSRTHQLFNSMAYFSYEFE